MNVFLYLFFGIVGLLLILFLWSTRNAKKRAPAALPNLFPAESSRAHVTYFPQIRRALAAGDEEFLAKFFPRKVLQRVRRERRRVVLAYLFALREDFWKLTKLATAIAVLSPEVVALRELERFGLTVEFAWRFAWIRLKLSAGLTPLTQMSGLSDLVSGLSVRMEEAMRVLGEQAALATEMVSTPDRSRIHLT